MVRRVVRCSMDANMEQPENRQFKSNPVDAVLANRGCYIAAVLTIVRAYRVAQYPGLLPPLMSFDDWSRLIRSALVWLGRADPVKTMDAARADDPNRSSLRAVVAAWQVVVGVGFDHRLTAGEIKEKACSVLDKDGLLNKAISNVASMNNRNEIDAVRLGKWLGRNKGRVADRLKILGEPDRHSKQMQWWLAELPKATEGK
jgi:putative DNA primase/helicase